VKVENIKLEASGIQLISLQQTSPSAERPPLSIVTVITNKNILKKEKKLRKNFYGCSCLKMQVPALTLVRQKDTTMGYKPQMEKRKKVVLLRNGLTVFRKLFNIELQQTWKRLLR
jgi:hypothetical protein